MNADKTLNETRYVPGIQLVLLLAPVLLATYIGAYALLVDGAVYTYRGGALVSVCGHYRVNHPAMAIFFAPINRLDIWLRPGQWENRSH